MLENQIDMSENKINGLGNEKHLNAQVHNSQNEKSQLALVKWGVLYSGEG